MGGYTWGDEQEGSAVEFPQDLDPPLEYIAVEPTSARRLEADPPERILVYTVHDGAAVPASFALDERGKMRVPLAELEERFNLMRDWGANRVAHLLAGALGLSSYARVRVARVLLDFNRFPGTTPDSAERALDFLAISEPFGTVLKHREKMDLLRIYDQMSDTIEHWVEGSLLNIGIHTYDAHNPSETKRPDVSIVTVPNTYQRESRMPVGLFDPIYPDLLAESTCSRALRDRLSLNLERSGFRVSHNQPYPLPEGSCEVRAQVWAFFKFLKQGFEKEFPKTKESEAYRLVWKMLLNTNLRSQEGDALFGYLHRYRRPPRTQTALFEKARDAYASVKGFVETSTVVRDYRRSPHRPSSLAIEIRKDLLVSFDENGLPRPSTPEQEAAAARVAEVMAGAIETYLDTDRQYANSGTFDAATSQTGKAVS